MKKILSAICAIALVITLSLTCFACSSKENTDTVYAFDTMQLFGVKLTRETIDDYTSALTEDEKTTDVYIAFLTLVKNISFVTKEGEENKGYIRINFTDDVTSKMKAVIKAYMDFASSVGEGSSAISSGNGIAITTGGDEGPSSEDIFTKVLKWLNYSGIIDIPVKMEMTSKTDVKISIINPQDQLSDDPAEIELQEVVNSMVAGMGFGVTISDSFTGTIKKGKVNLSLDLSFPKIVGEDANGNPTYSGDEFMFGAGIATKLNLGFKK